MVDSTNKGSDYPKAKSGPSNRNQKHTQRFSVSSPAKSVDGNRMCMEAKSINESNTLEHFGYQVRSSSQKWD